jgi:hypothetical protein
MKHREFWRVPKKAESTVLLKFKNTWKHGLFGTSAEMKIGNTVSNA